MSVIETILENRFFKWWRRGDDNAPENMWRDSNLEFFITGECNQNCQYCYLVKHHDLFPASMRDHKTILKNLHIVLEWCIENEFSFSEFSIFSGEIWHTDFGIDVLNTFLEYFQRGLKVNRVTIPSNCSFVVYDNYLYQIINLIEEYRLAGVALVFSASIDGALSDGITRKANDPGLTKIKSDDSFYKKLFSFCAEYNFLFHPMVSYENIRWWRENFDWWEKQCKSYGWDPYTAVMTLEVRNDGWDDESISHMTSFLSYIIDKYLSEECHGSIEEFAENIFCMDVFRNKISHGYLIFALIPANDFNGCTISDMMTIRLGDLAIAPCHRTAYDHLLYGKFIIENDKIIGIEEKNPQIASRILLQNSQLCTPGCNSCKYNYFCLRGCYGSQYETEKDPFIPIESCCNMFKAKIDFLIKRYRELGVIDYMETIPKTNSMYENIQDILSEIKRVERR